MSIFYMNLIGFIYIYQKICVIIIKLCLSFLTLSLSLFLSLSLSFSLSLSLSLSLSQSVFIIHRNSLVFKTVHTELIYVSPGTSATTGVSIWKIPLNNVANELVLTSTSVPRMCCSFYLDGLCSIIEVNDTQKKMRA